MNFAPAHPSRPLSDGSSSVAPCSSPALRHEVRCGRVVRCVAARPPHLAQVFAAAVARNPTGEAVVDGDRRLTYAELDQAVRELAGALLTMGISAGDRIAVLVENRLEYPVIVLAAALIGAVTVPMNVRQSPDETKFALNKSGARVLFHGAAARLPPAEATTGLVHRLPISDTQPLPRATAYTGPALPATMIRP